MKKGFEDEEEQEMEQVPTSRKKLLRFLREQSKEIDDFVKETDESRFSGAEPGEEKVSEDVQNMDVDISDSDSHISEFDIPDDDISGISEMSD